MTDLGHSTLLETRAVSVLSEPADVAKLYTLEDVDPIGRTELLLYGPPGSGKTVMASTMPPPFRWIAADGANSLKSIRWAMKEAKSAIHLNGDLVAYTPFEDMSKTHYPKAEAFDKMCDMLDYWFSPAQVDQWQTLVWDSATEISEWAMNKALAINGQLPKPDKPLSGSHKINTSAGLRILSGKQDYKSAEALFGSAITDVRVQCARHGKNFAVLCHEWLERSQDEESNLNKVIAIKPWLMGQLRERLSKDFDDVWYMVVYNAAKGQEHKVQLHKDGMHYCKTRWGTIHGREEPADYRTLIAKVREYHGL